MASPQEQHSFELLPHNPTEIEQLHEVLSNKGLRRPETAYLLGAALRGAREAKALFRAPKEVLQERYKPEEGNTSVSIADFRSEAAFFDTIGSVDPFASIYGEETKMKVGDPNRRYVVDGIDGSSPFLGGQEFWSSGSAFCQRFAEGLVPVSSAIVVPMLNKAIVAERDGRVLRINLDQRTLQIGKIERVSASEQARLYKAHYAIDSITNQNNRERKIAFRDALSRAAQDGNLTEIHDRSVGSNLTSGAFLGEGAISFTMMDCVGGPQDGVPVMVYTAAQNGKYRNQEGEEIGTFEQVRTAKATLATAGAIDSVVTPIFVDNFSGYGGFK